MSATSSVPYSEKLKDPRWQKKRLEILNRDGWKCTFCDDSKKTLHVHHKEYRRGAEPWEYSNDELKTLCVNCHETVTQVDRDIREAQEYFMRNVFGRCPVYTQLMSNLVTSNELEAFLENIIDQRVKKKGE